MPTLRTAAMNNRLGKMKLRAAPHIIQKAAKRSHLGSVNEEDICLVVSRTLLNVFVLPLNSALSTSC